MKEIPCWEDWMDGMVGSGRSEVDEWDVTDGEYCTCDGTLFNGDPMRSNSDGD
jgi:hypothetical protein